MARPLLNGQAAAHSLFQGGGPTPAWPSAAGAFNFSESETTKVGEINDAAIVAALGRQMRAAVAKQTAAASNLANINTPRYRAREVAFEDALDRKLGSDVRLAATQPGHLAGVEPADGTTREAAGLPARRDGNTVHIDRELLAMGRASGEFAAAQTALAAKFRLVKYAINEGR